jgi:hypothetical protein
MNRLSISAVRADALFVSSLQRSDEPSAGQVRQSVAAAVRQFGSRGCAGRVAQEFGDHPALAAARMRWAQRAIADTFGGPELRESGQRRAGQQPAGHAAGDAVCLGVPIGVNGTWIEVGLPSASSVMPDRQVQHQRGHG